MSDHTVDLLSTVCKDVCKEPCLQQSENGVELRADVSARGFCQRMQRAFVDVRLFYPFAPSYRCKTLAATFRSMELAKKGNKASVDGYCSGGTKTASTYSNTLSHLYYSNNEDCTFYINPQHSTGYYLEIKWVSFSVEGSLPSCSNDSVEVYLTSICRIGAGGQFAYTIMSCFVPHVQSCKCSKNSRKLIGNRCPIFITTVEVHNSVFP
eukprot:gene15801-7105_t